MKFSILSLTEDRIRVRLTDPESLSLDGFTVVGDENGADITLDCTRDKILAHITALGDAGLGLAATIDACGTEREPIL